MVRNVAFSPFWMFKHQLNALAFSWFHSLGPVWYRKHVDIILEDIISITPLWSLSCCMCVCAMLSSIYVVHDRHKPVACFFQSNLFIFTSCLFSRSFAWRESQKSIQHWRKKTSRIQAVRPHGNEHLKGVWQRISAIVSCNCGPHKAWERSPAIRSAY